MRLSPQDTTTLQQRLLDQLESLSVDFARHSGQAGTVETPPSRDPGELSDQAVSLGEREVTDSIAESEKNLAEKIRFALERIEDGSYGSCTDCLAAIPLERLRAKPAVSLCMRCQQAKERGIDL